MTSIAASKKIHSIEDARNLTKKKASYEAFFNVEQVMGGLHYFNFLL